MKSPKAGLSDKFFMLIKGALLSGVEGKLKKKKSESS